MEEVFYVRVLFVKHLSDVISLYKSLVAYPALMLAKILKEVTNTDYV